MKVYITQGHEEGIGLEVFFKSCLMLTQKELNHLVLLATKESVSKTLETLKLPFKLCDHIQIAGLNLAWKKIEKINISPSFTALEQGMKLAEEGGVLYTLPTSKDQFPKGFAGHTEYFRQYYKKPELGMFFSSPELQVLLVTDHLPITALSNKLSQKFIFQSVSNAVNTLQKWNWPIKKILIAGLNPHAGESGLIGSEDSRVSTAVKQLRTKYNFDIKGPLPGDTMLLEQSSRDDLLVYLFHDQGLGIFKGLQGFIGSNITLGLPYPRFSPDHGTSFSLFGKNQADYRGCLFSLRQAISMLSRVKHGQDTSHKSKSS
jgi:4-hydroxythreonine-4-phosphate dehydrogenase